MHRNIWLVSFPISTKTNPLTPGWQNLNLLWQENPFLTTTTT
jgi:hypothetical protein